MSSILRPVCPHCKTEMKPRHFEGYYESFPCWECKCEVIPGATVIAGSYSHATEGEPVER